MGTHVHSKKLPDGTVVYKLWSSHSQCYMSKGALTLEELRRALLEDDLWRLFSKTMNSRVESALLRVKKLGEWEAEMEHSDRSPSPGSGYAIIAELSERVTEFVESELAKRGLTLEQFEDYKPKT